MPSRKSILQPPSMRPRAQSRRAIGPRPGDSHEASLAQGLQLTDFVSHARARIRDVQL